VHAACAACAIFSGFLRRVFAGVETPAYRPTDEDLSVGTPVFHPTDVDLSVGSPPPSVYLPGPQRLGVKSRDMVYILSPDILYTCCHPVKRRRALLESNLTEE